MPTEILSGLWIGDINDSFNKEFINDNLITIFINCTLNYGFIDIPNTKKLRIPLSSNLDPQKDLILLKIETLKLDNLVWEQVSNGDMFPHLYSSLNISSVCNEYDITLNKDGTYNLPSNY